MLKFTDNKLKLIGIGLLALALLAGCTNGNANENTNGNASDSANRNSISNSNGTISNIDTNEMSQVLGSFEVDEQPGTVYYEIFVRSFYDSDGDGIGDLNGVTAKLDYLQELGVGGIWLMPINSSPSYHGYDTTDYYDINADYGTIDDFTKLLDEAHKRHIKVIMDLVVNHSSSEHPWFMDAAANPDSPYRKWYHFVPTDEQTQADNAAGSGNPWHHYGSSKYLGVFWGGMPDFNFDEPELRKEFISIGQFWLEKGLDGFRLDAAKHIYGDFKSTINTPDIQAANKTWWQEFRLGMDEVNSDAFLIGEVWDSMSVIGPYFDQALDSAFNFDLADRLISAAANERDPDLAYSLGRAHTFYGQSSNNEFIDAPFLSNHDQNRVMTVLGDNVDHARMAASLLLTLPGTPFLYYGEEIGMLGAKPDEYIREPMLWYSDPTGGEGQTSWQASRHNAAGVISVEVQQLDEQSLYNHYRKLIAWRNSEPALQNGAIVEYKLETVNSKLSAYLRVTKDDRLLVVHNLSGESQQTTLSASSQYGTFNDIVLSSTEAAELRTDGLSVPPYSSVVIR
ncbi:MAG TPA: DUF3459 domain-containing protein [Candidatus Paenibacillus intestinavium]|nr:DUF3459 domain-containing protein [Candidatus Paenibacillus intestinavium]